MRDWKITAQAYFYFNTVAGEVKPPPEGKFGWQPRAGEGARLSGISLVSGKEVSVWP